MNLRYLTAVSAARIMQEAYKAAKKSKVNGSNVLIEIIESQLDQEFIEIVSALEFLCLLASGQKELMRGAMLVIALKSKPESFHSHEATVIKAMALNEDGNADPWVTLLAKTALGEAGILDERAYFALFGMEPFLPISKPMTWPETEELEIARAYCRMARSEGYRLPISIS